MILKQFKIGDIFKVTGTKTTPPDKLIDNINKVPRITTKDTTNGLDGLYGNEPTEQGGVITVDSATVGAIKYQPYDFIATDHVEKISMLDNSRMSENLAMYIITSIKKEKRQKYLYGYKMSQKRIKNEKIILPVKNKNDSLPDWKYIEQFIQEKVATIPNLPKTKNKLTDRINLQSRKWSAFSLSKILGEPISGNDFPKYLRLSGNTPFVGSSSIKNGITDFIEKGNYTPNKYAKHVISVNRNGSVGCAFYHPYEAYFSGDTRFFPLDTKNIDIFGALFLVTVISQQKKQFGYGFKLGTERLKNLKINLPITKAGLPDWPFMSKYMQSLPYADLL